MTTHNPAPQPKLDTIGQRIQHQRLSLALSPQDLCEYCGWDDVSANAQKVRIGRYENNKRQPSIDDLLLLANALNTSFTYLAFGQQESSADHQRQPAAPNSATIQHLPLAQVTPDPEQPRKEFEPTALQELANSIQELGLIQPITVRQPKANGPYIIVCGERRYRACALAGLENIPAIVNNNIKDDNLFAVQIIENLQRKNLTLAETAKGVHQLRQQFSLEETAEKLSRSTSWVSRRANIPTMPDHVWQAVQNGHIGDANMATDLASLHQLDAEHSQHICARLNGEETGNWYLDNVKSKENITRAFVAQELKQAKQAAEAKKKRKEQEAAQQANKQPQETPEQKAAKAQQDADYAVQQKAQQAKDKTRADLIKKLTDTIVYTNHKSGTINTSLHDQSWRHTPEDIYISVDFFTNATAAPHVREWLNSTLPQLADLLIKHQQPQEA